MHVYMVPGSGSKQVQNYFGVSYFALRVSFNGLNTSAAMALYRKSAALQHHDKVLSCMKGTDMSVAAAALNSNLL